MIRASFALFAVAVIAGAAKIAPVCSAETGVDAGVPSSLAVSGEWGPRVNLRARQDAYHAYPQTVMRPRPSADGWWVTPIHVNLLPKGDILVTGWARVQERECETHGGRQWPAS